MDMQTFSALPDEARVRRDVAAQLTGGQSPSTLDRWARQGRYPQAARVGAFLLVRVGDLREWMSDPEAYAERHRPLA